MTTLGSLKSSAAAFLSDAIEAMRVDPMQLVAHAFSFPLATALARAIESGRPDIGELRGFGVDQTTAIAICSAIAARHARKESAMAAIMVRYAPVAKPEPLATSEHIAAPVKPAPEPIGRDNALNLLHVLALQINAERGCATELAAAGFSNSTAKELALTINQTRES
jgi:hypothetical protein